MRKIVICDSRGEVVKTAVITRELRLKVLWHKRGHRWPNMIWRLIANELASKP